MHEFIQSGQLVVDYSQTLTHRGDGFTKSTVPSKSLEARKLMSIVTPTCVLAALVRTCEFCVT